MSTAVLRPPEDADIPGLLTLLREGAAEVGITEDPQPEDIEVMWRLPGVDRSLDWRVADVGGVVAGAVGFRVTDAQGMSFGRVLPDYRLRGIGRALLDFSVARAREVGSVKELYSGTNAAIHGAVALHEGAGFSYARSFFRMLHAQPTAAQPATFPEGIRVDASLRGDAFLDAAIAAHDGSFIDHWNFHAWNREDARAWLTRERVDPELLFVAFGPDDAVAGLSLCFLDRGSSYVRGEVGVLGTTRPFRGIGLGRALLRHSLRALADRGATEVALSVDAENPSGALGLYERNGFTVAHEDRMFVLTL